MSLDYGLGTMTATTYCQTDLYEKGLRAQYKLTKFFLFLFDAKINTLLHLFEHAAEPVILHWSEEWDTVNVLSMKIKNK